MGAGAVKRVTRRQALAIAGATGVGAVAGWAELTSGRSTERAARAVLAPPVAGASPRQHAWTARLATDHAGNALPPRHQMLLVCALAAKPTPARAAAAESALRRIEHAAAANGAPLLISVAWGPSWFAHAGLSTPISRPRALSPGELPRLEDPVAVIHLGCDAEHRLLAATDALIGSRRFPGAQGDTSVAGLLQVTEQRQGFVGAGMPRAHQPDTTGLPRDRPIDRQAPLFMGFQSGLRRNQATEDDVTIASGRWAGATTMHMSLIALSLDSWYHGLGQTDRVRRMYSSDATPAKVRDHPTGLANPKRDLAAVAKRHNVVGHSEAMASARRKGRPVILRRDFNGVHDGVASVHFVSLQRSISEFERTRKAMNGAHAVGASPSVGQQVNNGIKEWMTVNARANLLVPARTERICPGLKGWRA